MTPIDPELLKEPPNHYGDTNVWNVAEEEAHRVAGPEFDRWYESLVNPHHLGEGDDPLSGADDAIGPLIDR